MLGKATIDKRTTGESRGKQAGSSRNYDVLGRELFTPDEVRKLDNKKCIVFIRGLDPVVDNKYNPFGHKRFNQTADGKGKVYVHESVKEISKKSSEFEILSKESFKYYEKLKESDKNVYIDDLSYEEFMMLDRIEIQYIEKK